MPRYRNNTLAMLSVQTVGGYDSISPGEQKDLEIAPSSVQGRAYVKTGALSEVRGENTVVPAQSINTPTAEEPAPAAAPTTPAK